MAPKSINYIYFGLFFLTLLLGAADGIFAHEQKLSSQVFFSLYALAQCAIEALLLTFLAKWFESKPKPLFFLFLAATCGLFFLHASDFFLNRILDLSTFHAIRIFVLDESLENFFYLLDASGISTGIWLLLFFISLLLPILAIVFYQFTARLCQKRPLHLQTRTYLQAFICLPAALALWDFSASKVVHPDAYNAFLNALPWKSTFFHPRHIILTLPPLKEPPAEQKVREEIATRAPLAHLPNIYLIIAESLREDCITKTIAPNLYAFKHRFGQIPVARSNGNATHLSWFSIFYSQPALFWRAMQQRNGSMGSPALYALKQMGYQIRLYGSAELRYYGMETALFGQNSHLLSSKNFFHHTSHFSAAEADRAALAQLQADLQDPHLQQGQVCILFWDSTHFDYSWPKNWTPPFTPFATAAAYFELFQSEPQIELIRNRYRNAVNYLDHLFGMFYRSLPQKAESIVLFTGDHGEEFFDEGHLFHNSHLSIAQIHVPLYMKFGLKQLPAHEIASQMDLFPTLFDYLGIAPVSFFCGKSLFQEGPSHAITARFNGCDTPYEFCIQNSRRKLILQHLNAKEARIVSIRDGSDRVFLNYKELTPWIEREFGPALRHYFPIAGATPQSDRIPFADRAHLPQD